MSAGAALTDRPPAVPSGREQIERLSEHASPCRYLAPANRVPFEQTAAYCERQSQEWGVPVWEFAAKAASR